ncbi:hypothetical protein LXL04_021291 [Taraxacum kok-saghyz]
MPPKMTPAAIRQMIATEVAGAVADEVSRAVSEAIPEIITAIREQLETVIDERVMAAIGATQQHHQRGFSYKEFSACSPPLFQGSTDPITCMRWVSDVEGAFLTIISSAKDWWTTWTKAMTNPEISEMPWEDFVTRFRTQYVPQVEMDRLAREFLTMEQTTESIPELNRKFNEMALFCPQYAADEGMKMARYTQMLRTDIREFVVAYPRTSLAELMDAARRREMEVEMQVQKRKAAQALIPASAGSKKGKTSDRHTELGSGGRGPLAGTEKTKPIMCYKCGQLGHLRQECSLLMTVCFQCGQPGHKRAECPQLRTTGGCGTPNTPIAAVPLRMTDGRTAPTGPPPTSHGRVYQLTADETPTSPSSMEEAEFAEERTKDHDTNSSQLRRSDRGGFTLRYIMMVTSHFFASVALSVRGWVGAWPGLVDGYNYSAFTRQSTIQAKVTHVQQITRNRPSLTSEHATLFLMNALSLPKSISMLPSPTPLHTTNIKTNQPPISPKLKSPRQPVVKRGGNNHNNDMTSSSDKLLLPLPTKSTTPKSAISIKKSKKCTTTGDHDHRLHNSVDNTTSTNPNSLAAKYSSAAIVDSTGSIAAARREHVPVMQVQRKMRIAHCGRSKSAKYDSCSKLTSYNFDPNSLTPAIVREEKRCSFITPNSAVGTINSLPDQDDIHHRPYSPPPLLTLTMKTQSRLTHPNLPNREGGGIDRSRDITRLQEFYRLYREKNNVDKLREEEMELRESGIFSGNFQELERKIVKTKRVFATLKVLGTVLEQLAKEVSPEEAEGLIPQDLKRVIESDAAMTEDLIAYNIIPLDAPAVTNVITSFPEKGNVSNQRENIVNVLSNEQSRLGTPDEHEPKLDETAVERVFLKSLDNYIKWCNYLSLPLMWSKKLITIEMGKLLILHGEIMMISMSTSGALDIVVIYNYVNFGNLQVCSGPGFLPVNPSTMSKHYLFRTYRMSSKQCNWFQLKSSFLRFTMIFTILVRVSVKTGTTGASYEFRKMVHKQWNIQLLHSCTKKVVTFKPGLQMTQTQMFWKPNTMENISL